MMPSIANQKIVPPEPLGELTRIFLKKCCCSDKDLASWTSKTRLLQDLDLFGDNSLDWFEVLHTEFGVDLTNFKFDKYFPKEFSMDGGCIDFKRLLRGLGLGNIVRRIHDKYPEVTFEMIEEVLRQKKWIF